jgi:membrane-bound lytic murein transglycosylase D
MYGVRLSELRAWNGLGRRSTIYPGQELLLRGTGRAGSTGGADLLYHVVQKGESLWKIARRYGVRVVDLVTWNNLRRSGTIYPGQSLRVY